MIYRQFSITNVSAMTLSVLVAFVLTPVLCTIMLKPGKGLTNNGFFGWFNGTFERGSRGNRGVVSHMLGKERRYLLVYALLVAAVVKKVMLQGEAKYRMLLEEIRSW